MNKEIYTVIRDRILSMEYRPGEILNEQQLAKEFGVSRTPLREVLTRLEWEKLVRILPRTGSMVTEIEFQKVIHIFQIRFELEELAGRLAAENITPEHLEQIKDIEKEGEQLYENMTQKDLIRLDKKLRSVVYDAANNTTLKEMSDSLHCLTQRLWVLIFEKGSWSNEALALMEEIKKTHDALSDGDPQKAGKMRRQLLNQNVQRIKKKF